LVGRRLPAWPFARPRRWYNSGTGCLTGYLPPGTSRTRHLVRHCVRCDVRTTHGETLMPIEIEPSPPPEETRIGPPRAGLAKGSDDSVRCDLSAHEVEAFVGRNAAYDLRNGRWQVKTPAGAQALTGRHSSSPNFGLPTRGCLVKAASCSWVRPCGEDRAASPCLAWRGRHTSTECRSWRWRSLRRFLGRSPDRRGLR
jgi:hypothetical protein